MERLYLRRDACGVQSVVLEDILVLPQDGERVLESDPLDGYISRLFRDELRDRTPQAADDAVLLHSGDLLVSRAASRMA